MKVIVTNKQLQLIREISDKEFSCEKCDHSWEIDKDDSHPYLCHMCGYESSKNEYNYDELEKFWKNYKKEDFPEHTDPKTGYVSPSSKVITDICEKEKFCKRHDPPLPPKISNVEETFWNDYKDILSEGKKDPLNLSKKDMKSLIDQGKKHMGYSEEVAKEEIEAIIQSIKNLPSEIKLFRIIRADDRKDIDTKTPGSHYAKNKKDLLSSHSFADGVGDFSFMITVLASKELVDIDQTIYNNLLYPNENEVTLKNKGEGVKIVSIRKIANQKEVNEEWSEKYKKSINCNNPEGFSQKAHCQGRKKKLKESKNDPHGYDINKIKEALLIASKLSTTFGEGIPLEFKLYGYNYKPSEMLMNRMDLYIDVNSEDGVYNTNSDVWHDISMNILDLFSMIGIRDEKYMKPLYDFKFNKRPLYDIKKV